MASQIHPFRSSRSSSTATLKLGNLLVPSSAAVALLPSLVERTVQVAFAIAILSPRTSVVLIIITAVTHHPYLGPSPSTTDPFLPYLDPFLVIASLHLFRHLELALEMVPILFDLALQALVGLVALEKPPVAELLVLHSYLNQSVFNLITCTI